MNKSSQIEISDYRFPADIGKKLKFAFVSDLHCCNNEPILVLLSQIQPDAVLVGGDFIHDNTRFQEGFDFLRRSAERWPTFCSIGNHELRYEGDLLGEIGKTGATALNNASVLFKGVRIGGLTSGLKEQNNLHRFTKHQPPDFSWLQSFSQYPEFKILLCHHPEYFDKYVRSFPVDLVLSGHAHGGQFRAFNRGIYAPGQGFLPKYTGGLYEKRLLVSRGLGNAHWIPRVNNVPEILVVHLLSRETGLSKE